MSLDTEDDKKVKKEDDYWEWFLADWPGLSIGLLSIMWSLATSPKYKLINGFESVLVNTLPGLFALILLTFGLIGSQTKVGKFITYSIWAIITFNIILQMFSGGSSGDCSRASPQFC
ncbi:hypothetical protein AN391_03688 [Pseudoalteromonas sp. P1-13-1a]|uniref:hypothetical protein n=1 Tax=Pseudoalteromonas sp. P1-13-1a TaxID=1723756 RepID=UPI0006D66BC7|nr:hypothetical protein [Pseudoalteromonas sp. P1-13-1a]KPZ52454.1 hypothetical protein AN391_03688 [Pseudoalteromonas sp. P1-13-1a]